MLSARIKARRDQHRSGRNRIRRAASSSNIEVSQNGWYIESDPSRRRDFGSTSSDLSYPNSGNTRGQIPTPSGTSYSPLDSNISEYQSIYGPLTSIPSQQSTTSSQGLGSEILGEHDADLYPATQQSLTEVSVPHTDTFHFSLNEDPPNCLPSQSDLTVMSLYQSWLIPKIAPHVLQNHGQPTVAGYQVDRAYVGYGPQLEENLSAYNQIQPLPDGAPTYYHISQVPPGEPWTPWNVHHEQVTNQSAFDNYTAFLEQQVHPPTATLHDQYVPPQSFWGTENDGQYFAASATETIELPSSDDPVGPPIGFEPGGAQQVDEQSRLDNAKGGRRHGPLHPVSAKNACKMRKEHVCMSCRMLREAVGLIYSFHQGKSTDELPCHSVFSTATKLFVGVASTSVAFLDGGVAIERSYRSWCLFFCQVFFLTTPPTMPSSVSSNAILLVTSRKILFQYS
ncbi:MAG: hypothetical protein Q9187_006826 [Circinaria calcarea]